MPPCLKKVSDGVEITLKIVPGASRDRIAGLLGNALKIQVAAPPENGKANAAVLALLAKTLGLSMNSLSLVRGMTTAQKVVLIRGVSIEKAAAALCLK